MIEYIAPIGRPVYDDEDWALYFCETYSVLIDKHGFPYFLLQCIETAGICDRYALLKAIHRESWRRRKLFKELSNGRSVEDALKELQDNKLIVCGSGASPTFAIRDILDKTAFTPTVRNGSNDMDCVEENPEFFAALLHPETMDQSQKEVLRWITIRDEVLRRHDRDKIHTPENAPAAYCTMENMGKAEPLKDFSMGQLYHATTELLKKHCIILSDKYPLPLGHPDRLTDTKSISYRICD